MSVTYQKFAMDQSDGMTGHENESSLSSLSASPNLQFQRIPIIIGRRRNYNNLRVSRSRELVHVPLVTADIPVLNVSEVQSVLSPSIRSTVTQARPVRDHLAGTGAASTSFAPGINSFRHPPSIMVVNSASLCKPAAIEQLTVEASNHRVQVIFVTETWLKARHADATFAIDGFNLHRRDRVRKVGAKRPRTLRGGGVVIYVDSSVTSTVYQYQGDNKDIELLIVKCFINNRTCMLIALYHPPNKSVQDTLVYLEELIEQLVLLFPGLVIIMAGDMNHLPSAQIRSIGMVEVTVGATRLGKSLDRIYTNEPIYTTNVRVVTSVIKTDHLVIVARANDVPIANVKQTVVKIPIRVRTPSRHAKLFSYLSLIDWTFLTTSQDPEQSYAQLYVLLNSLLDSVYPIQLVSVSSRDPYYYTPLIKHLLRRKNRLMRAGRVERAGALAVRIGRCIRDAVSGWMVHQTEGAVGTRQLWRQVSIVQGKGRRPPCVVPGISANDLNEHYARISTDSSYVTPISKDTVNIYEEHLSEQTVFRILSALPNTAAGPDGIPSWFLRLLAPFLSLPLAHIYNLSLSFSYVPNEWKTASITPVPKTLPPSQPSDYRPISVTSILSRVLEKAVVRKFIYPAIATAGPPLSFSDQHAFRPSGSTTTALISLLSTANDLLIEYPYLHLISLDMSKAFDTVRLCTLMQKFAQMDLPDSIYNWLLSFFSGRSHVTRYDGHVSSALPINSSVVQGSVLGPSSYDVESADLAPSCSINKMQKYADDITLLVPSISTDSVQAELDHVSKWARENNLTLNLAKSFEVIIYRKGTRPDLPPLLPALTRVLSTKVLGVTIDQHLDLHLHVDRMVSKGAQALFALKLLKTHGLTQPHLSAVTRSTLLNSVLYASPAWVGYVSVHDLERIKALSRKAVRWGLYRGSDPTVDTILAQSDRRLFRKITCSPDHVLHSLLPATKDKMYNLRKRKHDFVLTAVSAREKRNFIQRMLFNGIY